MENSITINYFQAETSRLEKTIEEQEHNMSNFLKLFFNDKENDRIIISISNYGLKDLETNKIIIPDFHLSRGVLLELTLEVVE